MYAVKWDEERVIKWMAVVMVLGLLAMAVMPAITYSEIYAGLKTARVIKGNKYADAFFLVGGGLGLLVELPVNLLQSLVGKWQLV